MNVEGAAVTLAAALEAGVKRAVLISSTAVYGVPKHHPLREDAPLVGVGDYGESKIEAERVARRTGPARARGRRSCARRPSSAPSGSASSRSSSTGSARAAASRSSATARTATSCSPSRIWSRRRSARRTAQVAGETFNVGATAFGTVRSDLEGLIAHAGSASRLRPVPARPPSSRCARSSWRGSHPWPSGTTARRTETRSSTSRRRSGCSASPAALERAGALRDLRLVPRQSRRARRGRRHAPRPVGPAGPGPAEAPELVGSDVAVDRVRPGDVGPGDVAPGHIAPGDIAPRDVTPGHVAPGDERPGGVVPAVEPGDLVPGRRGLRRREPRRRRNIGVAGAADPVIEEGVERPVRVRRNAIQRSRGRARRRRPPAPHPGAASGPPGRPPSGRP